VGRVFGLEGAGIEADQTALAFHVTHHRRQQHPPLGVGQAFGHAMAHRGHQRMGGAQVDAHRDAALVRVGRLAGFGDLQQRHVNGKRES
jgi:NAD-specific glutamate dehydrogenase